MSDYRPEIIQYISKRFAQEDDLLKKILADQKASGGPMMNIGPDQGKFLNLLVKSVRAKKVLELGSYFGYSSLWLARALQGIEDAKLECIEVDAKQCDYIQNIMQEAKLQDLVKVHNGPGLKLMQDLIDEKKVFDIVFIDADKANYSNYMDLAAQLLTSGGLLLVDNCLWDSKVLNDEDPDKTTTAIQVFNDKLAAANDFESTIVTLQDGLAFAIKR